MTDMTEKAMAPHSSTLAWKIPWTEEPGGLQSMGLRRVPCISSFCVLQSVEKAMAAHSSTLAWTIPWMEEPGGLQSMKSLQVRHDWATSLSLFTFMHWRRKWQPLQCSCLESPRDSRAWWAAVYGVAQSQTQLKWLSSSSIWTYHISFTHLSVDGLLGCLYSGAIYCCYVHSYTSFCVDIYFYFIWMYT